MADTPTDQVRLCPAVKWGSICLGRVHAGACVKCGAKGEGIAYVRGDVDLVAKLAESERIRERLGREARAHVLERLRLRDEIAAAAETIERLTKAGLEAAEKHEYIGTLPCGRCGLPLPIVAGGRDINAVLCSDCFEKETGRRPSPSAP